MFCNVSRDWLAAEAEAEASRYESYGVINLRVRVGMNVIDGGKRGKVV